MEGSGSVRHHRSAGKGLQVVRNPHDVKHWRWITTGSRKLSRFSRDSICSSWVPAKDQPTSLPTRQTQIELELMNGDRAFVTRLKQAEKLPAR